MLVEGSGNCDTGKSISMSLNLWNYHGEILLHHIHGHVWVRKHSRLSLLGILFRNMKQSCFLQYTQECHKAMHLTVLFQQFEKENVIFKQAIIKSTLPTHNSDVHHNTALCALYSGSKLLKDYARLMSPKLGFIKHRCF